MAREVDPEHSMSAGRRRLLLAVAFLPACRVGTGDRANDADPFGTRVQLGSMQQVIDSAAAGDGFFSVPDVRGWIVRVPVALRDQMRAGLPEPTHPGLDAGFLALSQRCPHQGCRLTSCATSAMFECPCCGSKFSKYGEYRSGPAPRGMDRYPIDVVGNVVVVDSGDVLLGTEGEIDLSGQKPEGPFCIQ